MYNIPNTSACVLIVAPHGSYRTMAYIQAAESMQLRTLVASEGKHSIVSAYASGIHIDFTEPEQAYSELLKACEQNGVTAIIATDDSSTVLATKLAQHFGFPHNPVDAVRCTQRKDLARQRLSQSNVNIPEFEVLSFDDATTPSPEPAIAFPLVVKPVAMSASRGVIRANNVDEFNQALQRVRRIIDAYREDDPSMPANVLVESFIEGREYAFEGLLSGGEMMTLAIFDKPDPLDGPYFEETYYITPSSLDEQTVQCLTETVTQACKVYGLSEGPIHAECRVNVNGIYVIEIAARTIGGLCSNLLQFGTGHTLEHIVLAHAARQPVEIQRADGAAGVLMIPITKPGVLKRVEGVLNAQKIKYIDSVQIQIREGHEIVPLPEGASYLGFIFASAPNVQLVEQALRDAHAALNIVVTPMWKIGGQVNSNVMED